MLESVLFSLGILGIGLGALLLLGFFMFFFWLFVIFL